MFDATFWVAISFAIFCLIIIYKKIPQVINNLLDSKINEIKSEIDNAKNLKNESQQLLQKYKTKIEEANIEAGKIINNEKKETKIFTGTEAEVMAKIEAMKIVEVNIE